MGVKDTMATILRNQLELRGVHSLAASEYEKIAEVLVEQLRELELSLAAREFAEKQKPR